MHTYIYIYAYLYTYVYIYICIYVSMYVYICIYICKHVCLYVYMFYVYMIICLYVYVNVCVYIYVDIKPTGALSLSIYLSLYICIFTVCQDCNLYDFLDLGSRCSWGPWCQGVSVVSGLLPILVAPPGSTLNSQDLKPAPSIWEFPKIGDPV